MIFGKRGLFWEKGWNTGLVMEHILMVRLDLSLKVCIFFRCMIAPLFADCNTTIIIMIMNCGRFYTCYLGIVTDLENKLWFPVENGEYSYGI